MSVLFSAVTVTVGDEKTEFLVCGIPNDYGDLDGWSQFNYFMDCINKETEIAVKVKAYLYGDGEAVKATPEEVAYFIQRSDADNMFLSEHCENIGNTDFTFTWSPNELFNMEVPK